MIQRTVPYLTIAAAVFSLAAGIRPAHAAGTTESTAVGPVSVPIEIVQPWTRAVVNAGGNGGVYMQIRNATDRDDRLTRAYAEGVARVELHTHEMDGDMARMRQVPHISIRAGELVELAPRGLHVMLMGVEEPLAEGDELDLTLVFEHAGEVDVPVPVRSVSGTTTHRH